jgi:hypothetical protein
MGGAVVGNTSELSGLNPISRREIRHGVVDLTEFDEFERLGKQFPDTEFREPPIVMGWHVDRLPEWKTKKERSPRFDNSSDF